jgi:hypothetical protein
MTCPACGCENDTAAWFCAGCGANLVSAGVAAETRKVVTVFVIDLDLGETSWLDRTRCCAGTAGRWSRWRTRPSSGRDGQVRKRWGTGGEHPADSGGARSAEPTTHPTSAWLLGSEWPREDSNLRHQV